MADNYPNYRVTVEAIIKAGNRILLTKRADNCDVAPGVWCVPAGKVKYEEIPTQAVVRECREETGLDVGIVREVDCRTLVMMAGKSQAFRLVFTYLVESATQQISLNDEHSEYSWVDLEALSSAEYSTLSPELRQIILSQM